MEKPRIKEKNKRKMDVEMEKKKSCGRNPSHRTTGRDRTSGA